MRAIFTLILIAAISLTSTAQKRISAGDAFSQGIDYFYDNALPQAMQCFKIWLGTHPDDAYSWTYVAAIENEAKHYYAALDASDKALAGTFANDADTTFKSWHQYIRSLIHLNLGDTTAAIGDLTAAITLNHSDADAYQRRATLHFRRGSLDEALADYRHAATLAPSDAEPFIGMGCVYSSRGDRQAAIEAFTAATGAESDNSRAYSHRAAERYNNGEFDAAIDDVLQALTLDRESVHALWVLEFLKADAADLLQPKVKAIARSTGDNTWLELLPK